MLFGSLFRKAAASLPAATRDRLFMVFGQYATPISKQRLGSPSMEGALEIIRKNGFEPGGIIDVGAFVGEWGALARRVFPRVPLLMLEANEENEAALQRAATELQPATYRISLLGAESRQNVAFHKNGKGTSVLQELTAYKTVPARADMHTLDELAAALAEPLLLKLDVQGYELEVLRGGIQTLRRSEFVLLETSTLPYNEGGPLFADVIRFMADAGYAVFDICDHMRRQTDDALFQIDVLFAKSNSKFRAQRAFWLAEQSVSI